MIFTIKSISCRININYVLLKNDSSKIQEQADIVISTPCCNTSRQHENTLILRPAKLHCTT